MIHDNFDILYPEASKNNNGLMSQIDKIKLDNINTDDIEYIKNGIEQIKEFKVPQFIYGIEINMDDSNPTTSVKYTDDAVGFTPLSIKNELYYGSWDNFIHNILKVKPCLFKGGKVIAYLDENDYSRTINGNNIDIKTGDYGDVMIEFSKVYYKLSRIGNIITFKVSNKKSDNSWSDAAFSCNDGLETVKDKMYIAAYQGVIKNTKLRSISNATPNYNSSMNQLRTAAAANGSRYQLNSIVKYNFLMYLTFMITKSLNIQSRITDTTNTSITAIDTGTMDKDGLFYAGRMGIFKNKLFGIENLYGVIHEYVEGLTIHLDNYRFKKSGPYNNLKAFTDLGPYTQMTGFIKKEKVINGMISIPDEVGASSSTYFCGYCNIVNNNACVVGGYYNNIVGITPITFIDFDKPQVQFRTGGRLCY